MKLHHYLLIACGLAIAIVAHYWPLPSAHYGDAYLVIAASDTDSQRAVIAIEVEDTLHFTDIIDTNDISVAKMVEDKHDQTLFTTHAGKDSINTYAHYFGRGWAIYIQTVGYNQDTTVFIKHHGESVCVNKAVEYLIVNKLLK